MTAGHPHLLVLIGIPGSGKSTYAARLQARCPSLVLVSPDAIRNERYPGYAEGRVDVRGMDDRHIFRLAYRAVAEALAAGRHVIFDATSLTVTRRRKLLNLAQRHGARVSARYFPIPFATALHRNRLRARQVPSGVIARMACLLMPPQYDEGFTRIVVDHQT